MRVEVKEAKPAEKPAEAKVAKEAKQTTEWVVEESWSGC